MAATWGQMDYWYKENAKNIYSLFWILNLTNMCICIYCVRVNETCKFKMALNIKSSISWIHKQTIKLPLLFYISWQRILYISCFTNIHTKTWRAIRIIVQVLLYQAVATWAMYRMYCWKNSIDPWNCRDYRFDESLYGWGVSYAIHCKSTQVSQKN